MKVRCQPGDRCVIVADVRGCEANIGAEITITVRVPFLLPPAWEFKDASRPLKMLTVDPTTNSVDPQFPATWVTSTRQTLSDTEYPACFDHHLVPIHGEGEVLLEQAPEAVAA